MELRQRGRLHFKVDIADNSFPMTIKIDKKDGDYEVLVSRDGVADEATHDYKFTQEQFRISYPKSYEYKSVYLTVLSFSKLRIAIMVSFHSTNDRNLSSDQDVAKSPVDILRHRKSEQLDPFPDFDPRTQKYPAEVGRSC